MNALARVTVVCPLLWAACMTPADDGTVTVIAGTAGDAEKADTANSLTTWQQRVVLTTIDNTCGDTWCEGDMTWAFKKIVCRFDLGTCTMTTLVSVMGEDTFYWRSCKMYGLSTFRQLVRPENGAWSLTDTMFTKVDRCITKIEDSVR